MMRVLVDGYNLLHALGLMRERMGPAGLEKARRALVGRLRGTYGDAASGVTVVFDAGGAYPAACVQEGLEGVDVRFAVHHEQADDLIEQLIREHSAPASLIVVSDDRRLKQAALRRKCISMGCQDYLDSLPKIRAQRRRRAPVQGEGKPTETVEQEHWLSEFAHLKDDPDMKRLSGLDPFSLLPPEDE